MKCYVLDACALLALANDEQGAEEIEGLFNKSLNREIELIIHKINLLEVHYILRKKNKLREATEILGTCEDGNLGIKVIDGLKQSIFEKSSTLKAAYRLSLADSIAIATAQHHSGLLVTSDHKEMEPIAKDINGLIHWFR